MADDKQQQRKQTRTTTSTPPRRVDAVVVSEDNALAVQTRGEIEIMMEMARRYPRSIEEFRTALRTMALKDEETADECTYELPRDGKMIPGPSIRFAELAMYCWGHMMAFAMPVSEDGKTITCRGVAWDLQRNNRMGGDSKRRILTKQGERYSDDMIIVTMNAGNSIAKRNAILQAIPSSEWRPIWEEARVVAVGKVETIATKRANLCDALIKIGAKLDLVWRTFGVKGPADLDLTQIATIRGYYKAIRDGQLTVEDAFPDDEAPSLSGEIVDAQMRRLAEEQMELAADIETEFKRREMNQAQRVQKLTQFNGRWQDLLLDLRSDLPKDAAPVETKRAEPEPKPAERETPKPPAETKQAEPETVKPSQQTIVEAMTNVVEAAKKTDPFADVQPSNDPEKAVNQIEAARRRMHLKPGQTF